MEDIRERFRESLIRLFRKNLYLATEVTKLGYPSLDRSFPTAWVEWDSERKRVKFCFHPDFYKALDDEEFDFIVAHEARHIINCHLFTLKDHIDQMRKNNEDNKAIMRFMKKFWIAEDCVANDTLVNIDGLTPIWKDPPEVSGKMAQAVYGENFVGMDCHDLTAMDVFYMLDDEKLKEMGMDPNQDQMLGPGGGGGGLDSHEPWETFMDQDGSLKREFVEKVKEFIEDNIQNSNLSQDETMKILEMKNSLEGSKDKTTKQILAGKGIGGKKKGVSRTDDNIKWNMIISELVEFKKIEDTWNRPNRKLMSFYPDTLLPSWKDQEKQLIVAFIDKSGSMSPSAVNKLSNVLRNCPDHIVIKTIMFDTACKEIDLEKEEPIPGGGTNFQIIEDYCNKMKKYPKAVLVLTDGGGTEVKPKHPNKWIWLLYGGLNNHYCKDMKHYDINELLS